MGSEMCIRDRYYTLFTERTQVDGIAQVQILDNIPKGDDSG